MNNLTLLKYLKGFLFIAFLFAAPPGYAADEPARIGDEAFKTMLTNLGYEYVTGEYIGGSKFYQIKYPYSGSDYYIRLSGANDPVIWGVLELGTIEKDRPVPPSVMQSMLDENSRAIRFYFSISKDARELRLKAPLPNDTITPIKLRQFVQEAVEQVARTSAVWNMNAWPKTNIVAENADIKTMTAEGNALAVP